MKKLKHVMRENTQKKTRIVDQEVLYCLRQKCTMTAVKVDGQWKWEQHQLRYTILQRGGIKKSMFGPWCTYHEKVNAALGDPDCEVR